MQRVRGTRTVASMDDETREVLQDAAGEAAAIPQRLRHRLRGDSITALRNDAKRLARELGIAEPQPRDERGKFASMDDLMRGRT